jgi:arabinogalactan endo-1,4-beta-galactosidase
MTHPAPAEYPFTATGQATFMTDFSAAVRGHVEAIHYWYPEWYPGFDSASPALENCGLFSARGVGLPALDVFNAIAERRLLP